MEFCEQHLADTADSPVALFPIRDQGDQTWWERIRASCDEMSPTFHTGFTASSYYAHYTYNMLHEERMVNTSQHELLKEYGQQNAEMKKSNRELAKGV
jgi:hypothetical protein